MQHVKEQTGLRVLACLLAAWRAGWLAVACWHIEFDEPTRCMHDEQLGRLMDANFFSMVQKRLLRALLAALFYVPWQAQLWLFPQSFQDIGPVSEALTITAQGAFTTTAFYLASPTSVVSQWWGMLAGECSLVQSGFATVGCIPQSS